MDEEFIVVFEEPSSWAHQGCSALLSVLESSDRVVGVHTPGIRSDDRNMPQLVDKLRLTSQLRELRLAFDKGSCLARLTSALPDSSRLKQLNTYCSRVLLSGAEAIGKLIPRMRFLRDINLIGSAIGPRGCDAISSGLAAMNSIRRVVLRMNPIGDDGITRLLQ